MSNSVSTLRASARRDAAMLRLTKGNMHDCKLQPCIYMSLRTAFNIPVGDPDLEFA